MLGREVDPFELEGDTLRGFAPLATAEGFVTDYFFGATTLNRFDAAAALLTGATILLFFLLLD